METTNATVKPSSSKRNADMRERLERTQAKVAMLAELDAYLSGVRKSESSATLAALIAVAS